MIVWLLSLHSCGTKASWEFFWMPPFCHWQLTYCVLRRLYPSAFASLSQSQRDSSVPPMQISTNQQPWFTHDRNHTRPPWKRPLIKLIANALLRVCLDKLCTGVVLFKKEFYCMFFCFCFLGFFVFFVFFLENVLISRLLVKFIHEINIL